jgi:hypothetical protein
MPVTRICKNCGEEYSTPPSQRLLYCSADCYNKTKVGAGNPKWRGGTLMLGGYRYIYAPKHPNATKVGYVAEHRLVMENKIGRLLTRTEVVHHKDENKLNNSIHNLELCASNGIHTMENHTERDAFGRFRGEGKLKPRKHGNQKLITKQVIEIRRRREQGETLQEIADDFDVTFSTVWSIVNLHSHKNI